MELFNSRRITNIGVMTAIYVVATLLCAPFAYKEVQFRISEILMLFCFFKSLKGQVVPACGQGSVLHNREA